MKKMSIWQDNLKFNGVKLNKNKDVDVLIIGGGITGLSTAYYLKDSNLKVALIDGNFIGKSVTTKSTGKITFLQDILVNIDDKNLNKYIESQIYALGLLNKIIKDNKIKCDYTKAFHRLFSNDKVYKLEDLYEKIKKYGVLFKDNYLEAESFVFNPCKYLCELKKICLENNIDIYENTRAYEILKGDEGFILKTSGGDVRCRKVVFTTHYLSFLKPLFLPMHSYLEKSYLCAVKTNDVSNVCGISIDDEVVSYRYYKDYYIYLSEVSNTSNVDNDLSFHNLTNSFKDICYIWSNKDVMTIDGMPYIGEVCDNVFGGFGYNTWGMTNGTLAGKVISDLILGNKNKYEFLNFNRGINVKDYVKFPMIINNSLMSYFKTKVKKNANEVMYKNINGDNVVIYKDGINIYAVYNTCPHLKCGVVFNKTERIWECPCHGSKFDINGKCIEGPSNYDIGYKGSLDELRKRLYYK